MAEIPAQAEEGVGQLKKAPDDFIPTSEIRADLIFFGNLLARRGTHEMNKKTALGLAANGDRYLRRHTSEPNNPQLDAHLAAHQRFRDNLNHPLREPDMFRTVSLFPYDEGSIDEFENHTGRKRIHLSTAIWANIPEHLNDDTTESEIPKLLCVFSILVDQISHATTPEEFIQPLRRLLEILHHIQTKTPLSIKGLPEIEMDSDLGEIKHFDNLPEKTVFEINERFLKERIAHGAYRALNNGEKPERRLSDFQIQEQKDQLIKHIQDKIGGKHMLRKWGTALEEMFERTLREGAETHPVTAFRIKQFEDAIVIENPSWEQEVQAKIDELKASCLEDSGHIQPISGRISLGNKNALPGINNIFLKQINQGRETTQLNCTGYADLRVKNTVYRLRWEMNGEGEIEIFTASLPEINTLKLELTRLILEGLQDGLVTRHEAPRPVQASSPQSHDPGPSEPELAKHVIQPRVVSSIARSISTEPIIHTGPITPRDTEKVIELLAKDTPIILEDIEGSTITLYTQEEVPHPKRPESKIIVYLPIPTLDTLKTLNELRTEQTPKTDIYLMKRSDTMKRLGYSHSTKGNIKTYEQKRIQTADTIRDHIEEKTVRTIKRTLSPEDNRLEVSAGPEITTIRIKTLTGTTDIPVTEILNIIQENQPTLTSVGWGAMIDQRDKWTAKEVFENPPINTISKGWDLRIVLNVPQTPQYDQGSYASIAKAETQLRPSS